MTQHPRRRLRLTTFSPLLLLLAATLAVAPRAAHAAVQVVSVATSIPNAVAIVDAGDRSGRLFVVRQTGTIVILNGSTRLATPFIDLSGIISCCGERGLLNIAFHPDYETNGLFDVYYTNTSGNVVVARYSVSADPNVADAASGQIVLTIAHPSFDNHNGGGLIFGPDGYLYISVGDGGSGCDPNGNGQNTGVLLAKMLRIDVDGDDFPGDPNRNYAIPPTNPFVGVAGNDEIWDYGLRNPFRFSFDRQTGDLWIGDVGQGEWEEVDMEPAGSSGGINYGWRCREGLHPSSDSGCDTSGCPSTGFTDPLFDYQHLGGLCAITGGYRYRGAEVADLAGKYVYADYCLGSIFVATEGMGGSWSSTTLSTGQTLMVTSFGEDEAGELYFSDFNAGGRIWRFHDPAASDLIFDDGFESNDLAAWTATSTDGGDLATSAAAALVGSVGLAATVNDTNELWVEDDRPVNENHYRARFYFDPNGFAPGMDGQRTKLFQLFEKAPLRRLLTVALRVVGGQYKITAKAHLDDATWANPGFFDLSDGPHSIEIDWVRASSAAVHDGSLELWIDGTSVANLTGLANAKSSVDFSRLGVLKVQPGASGTIYFDAFQARRAAYIGP
jgi:glucose/arabinose dehydrogenase